MRAKYLLISRIGRKSLHHRWATDADERNYDVLLSCYESTVPAETGDGLTFEYRPGSKVAGYYGLLCDRADELAAYDYVAMWDEDLEADVQTINTMFDIGAMHNLKVYQPSLTLDSHFTYAGVLQQPGLVLRWVTFVEMMAPVFRTDILPVIRDIHGLGYESGIDLIWSAKLPESERDLAIIDATAIRHTEPVGGRKDENGFTGATTYEDHIYAVLDEFELPWQRCVPHAGLTRRGRAIRSKLALTALSATALRSVPMQFPTWRRLRSVLVHIRHVVLGPLDLSMHGVVQATSRIDVGGAP
jgi:hypothetical protein